MKPIKEVEVKAILEICPECKGYIGTGIALAEPTYESDEIDDWQCQNCYQHFCAECYEPEIINGFQYCDKCFEWMKEEL